MDLYWKYQHIGKWKLIFVEVVAAVRNEGSSICWFQFYNIGRLSIFYLLATIVSLWSNGFRIRIMDLFGRNTCRTQCYSAHIEYGYLRSLLLVNVSVPDFLMRSYNTFFASNGPATDADDQPCFGAMFFHYLPRLARSTSARFFMDITVVLFKRFGMMSVM
uniref:Uncharacterized protein n=1 Tax=Helicotheca tamesis TaxID=374047 RepID=A0A7S2MZG2_9STRA|mmetsp:Transcript_6419/g.8677  ORF Transcript_6419/g.8677 Transcript_6419/m.8677 type:complete len:161 (+) Transcript_6419:363-845(+)